jgi:hypothetical protein
MDDVKYVHFRMEPSWSWRTDAEGEYVEMSHVLPCGHKITARSRTSNTQLGRNFRRMAERHKAHATPPTR